VPAPRFAPVPDDDELYELLNLGLALYAGGHPFEAHEVWEYAWGGEVGRNKLCLQALIQVAAAVHKHAIGVPGGACKLMAKARAKLEEVRGGASAWLGVDLVALAAELDRAQGEVDAVALGRGQGLEPPALPRVSAPDGILYLHGFASSPGSRKAAEIAEPLRAAGFRVAVPDLNEGDFEHLTLSRALDLARRHVTDRCLVIGSSMGGLLASLLAARDDRVKALVLMAPAFDFGAGLLRRHADGLEPWKRSGVTLVDHYATGRKERLAWGFMEDALGHPGYPPIRVPTYVLHGSRDDVVEVGRSERAAALWPEAIELDVVDDDHALLASADRALAAARRMIERLGLRPAPEPVEVGVALEVLGRDPRFAEPGEETEAN
jgi:pimeloyl-ACP methyl ester carboxylesterase